jgi:glycerol-3-phosphate dehydrogenase
MKKNRVIVIGGGCTGAAIAHDLALRGVEVVVIERGEMASGTTGRCSCYIHSGARYAVKDKDSARECIEENHYLQKILHPSVYELNQGVYIQLLEDDPAYVDEFFDACIECGIPVKEMPVKELLAREPNISKDIRRVALIPDDAVIEPLRLTLSFAASAVENGAHFMCYTEVVGFTFDTGRVTGVRVRNRILGIEYEIKGDLVINATGPWAGTVAKMAGVNVPISLSPGVHVILGVRLTHMVIDRLHAPSSGDFIYPLRNQSILGTSSWTVQDNDYIHIPEAHIRQMYDLCGKLVPSVKKYPPLAINAATRPLVAQPGKSERDLSRRFELYDHEALDNVESFLTITGGKMATTRAMAELVSNAACQKLGIDQPCQTRTHPLSSYRHFYQH